MSAQGSLRYGQTGQKGTQRQPRYVADIGRITVHPVDVASGNLDRFDPVVLDNTFGQYARHRGIVGRLAWLQFEPTSTDHLTHRLAVAFQDRFSVHEFDRTAERVADC